MPETIAEAPAGLFETKIAHFSGPFLLQCGKTQERHEIDVLQRTVLDHSLW